MAIQIISKKSQAHGAFNGGEIVENKPIGFPQDGGNIKPYSNLFYWANAEAQKDSTIGLHPHQGFEIMSFVLAGSIRHYDTKLKQWRDLEAGDVQIIRAGNGISHAEHMNAGSRMFQIWFDPNLSETLTHEATYNDYKAESFDVDKQSNLSSTYYVGEGHPIMMASPGINISLRELTGPFDMQLDSAKIYSIYILKGSAAINGEKVNIDDFVKLENMNEITLDGNCTFFMVESNKTLTYSTYAERMRRGI